LEVEDAGEAGKAKENTAKEDEQEMEEGDRMGDHQILIITYHHKNKNKNFKQHSFCTDLLPPHGEFGKLLLATTATTQNLLLWHFSYASFQWAVCMAPVGILCKLAEFMTSEDVKKMPHLTCNQPAAVVTNCHQLLSITFKSISLRSIIGAAFHMLIPRPSQLF